MPKRKTYVTPVGDAVYPHLNEPDFKYKKERGEYHVMVRLPEDDPWVREMTETLEGIREEHWNEELKKLQEKKPKAKLETLKKQLELGPIGIASEQDPETEEETGYVLVKVTMAGSYKDRKGREVELAPKLVDAKKNPMDLGVPIWSGSRIKVAFFALPYDSPAVGVGVSLKLIGAQVIELASGQDASHLFDEEEGYEFDEGDVRAASPSKDDGGDGDDDAEEDYDF